MLYEEQFVITPFVIKNFYNKTCAVNIRVQEIKKLYSKAIVLGIDSRSVPEAKRKD